MGFTKPNESPRSLVRSYRTVSPLPRTALFAEAAIQPFGGLFSVALSLASRPVDVIDHPALRSPDFPPINELASKLGNQRSPHPLAAERKDGFQIIFTQAAFTPTNNRKPKPKPKSIRHTAAKTLCALHHPTDIVTGHSKPSRRLFIFTGTVNQLSGEPSSPISGKRISFAGKLGGMNRREATNLLRSFGATVVDLDAPRIDWVVIGAEESPLSEHEILDQSISQLAASGQLEVLSETELWQRLDLVDVERHVKTLYTPAMLADLLKVSVRIIRRWHRRGLIIPVRTLHKLPYFDFQEVATARRLAELVAAGASPEAIESRLRELAMVLPDVQRPLAQLSVIVEGQHVLLRQGEGLIEPGGQLRFDFSATDRDDSIDTIENSILPFSIDWRDTNSTESTASGSVTPQRLEHDDLLEDVYALEESGDLTSAIDLCHAILARDGMRADICFQLGELLYRDGQIEAARERYYAAIELDETFVEARTNLACVLAETGRHDLAIAALQGVLTLYEDYPDAHYNLAISLEAVGDHATAKHHWQRFSQLAPNSPWAGDAPTSTQ